jgi:hypothetical protein
MLLSYVNGAPPNSYDSTESSKAEDTAGGGFMLPRFCPNPPRYMARKSALANLSLCLRRSAETTNRFHPAQPRRSGRSFAPEHMPALLYGQVTISTGFGR